MKTAYLDAFSGLSGDMLVGALLDAGADFESLRAALRSLGVGGYELAIERRTVSGISAVKFNVNVSESQPERHLSEICAMIEGSALSDRVKRTSIEIFRHLANAEAKVHHTTPEHVHFHEVGAVDSIVDITGTAWALDQLGIAQMLVSPLPAGKGIARSQHGTIPVPAPATAELLTGFPLKLNDGESEMVTPTGAAVVRTLARPAPIPLQFEIEKIGYGAGSKTFADRPNVLRLMIGHERTGFATDELLQIETNIDDLNPQIYDFVCDRLFKAGARDVTLTPTVMKKGRPAITVSILAEPAKRDAIAAVLFEETTTIGLRYSTVSRLMLEREVIEVETSWGRIHVKISRGPNGIVNCSPEYDDCKQAAERHGVALKLVMQEAQSAAQARYAGHDHGHGHHHH